MQGGLVGIRVLEVRAPGFGSSGQPRKQETRQGGGGICRAAVGARVPAREARVKGFGRLGGTTGVRRRRGQEELERHAKSAKKEG